MGVDELGLILALRVLHFPAEVLVEFSYTHERDERRPFRLGSRRARRVKDNAQIFENSHFFVCPPVIPLNPAVSAVRR